MLEGMVLKAPIVCFIWAAFGTVSRVERRCNESAVYLYLEPSKSRQSWSSSADLCKAGRGKLPEIKSWEMQTCLEDFARGVTFVAPFFVDLRRQNLGSASYESVASNMTPSIKYVTGNSNENFLKVISGDVQPLTSNSVNHFICKFDNNSTCPNCIHGRGKYYQVNKSQTCWYSARNHCLERGGDLIDYEDLKFMNGTDWDVTQYFLGHSRIKWVWSEEKEFTRYTNWHGGCESTSFDDAKKCVVVNSGKDYKWEAAECHSDVEMAVVCMRNISTARTEYLQMVVGVSATLGLLLVIAIGVMKARLSGRRKRQRGHCSYTPPLLPSPSSSPPDTSIYTEVEFDRPSATILNFETLYNWVDKNVRETSNSAAVAEGDMGSPENESVYCLEKACPL